MAKTLFKNRDSGTKLNIEVLYLPHISNFTDLDPLLKEEDVNLRYVRMEDKIGNPDLLIIPGTKNTIWDLSYLKKAGYIDKIRELAKQNTMIMGICGGFQMLGRRLIDIKGSESRLSMCEGLGLFNIVTRFMPSKITAQVEFESLKVLPFDFEFSSLRPLTGYEIHLGRTKYLKGSQPLFKITKRNKSSVEILDGAINEKGNILGTYIHGIFDNGDFRNSFLNILRKRKGLSLRKTINYDKDIEFDRLEDLLRRHLDINKIYGIIGIKR